MASYNLRVRVSTDVTTDPAAELLNYLDRMGYREVNGVHIDEIELLGVTGDGPTVAEEDVMGTDNLLAHMCGTLSEIRDLLRSRL